MHARAGGPLRVEALTPVERQSEPACLLPGTTVSRDNPPGIPPPPQHQARTPGKRPACYTVPMSLPGWLSTLLLLLLLGATWLTQVAFSARALRAVRSGKVVTNERVWLGRAILAGAVLVCAWAFARHTAAYAAALQWGGSPPSLADHARASGFAKADALYGGAFLLVPQLLPMLVWVWLQVRRNARN